MKSLQVLLRVARRDLDVLRRALAEQNTLALAVEDRRRGHEQTILSEQKAALRDYQSTRAYGGYAATAIAVRQALEAHAAAIEAESGRLRGLIAEAHVEMRKFERLLELQAERERAAAAKREDAELDEVATLRGNRLSPR